MSVIRFGEDGLEAYIFITEAMQIDITFPYFHGTVSSISLAIEILDFGVKNDYLPADIKDRLLVQLYDIAKQLN